MIPILIAMLLAQGSRTGARDRDERTGGRSHLSSSVGCSPACVSPQYCVGTTCADPQFSFATASGVGMGAECAGTALTTVQGGAVTFTRAGSGYCTKGNVTTGLSNTSMSLRATDEPRAMKGGDGTGAIGLLVELAGTNSTIRSEEFDDITWLSYAAGASAAVVTANAGTSPANGATADEVVFGALALTQHSALRQLLGACPEASGGGDWQSVYAKAVSPGSCPTGVDLCTNDSTQFYCTNNAVTDTSWTRIVNPNTTVDGATNRIYYVGNLGFSGYPSADFGLATRSACDVYLWGAQCEATPFTSYIPTTTVAVTRAIDVASAAYTAAGGTIGMSLDVWVPAAMPSSGAASWTPLNLGSDASNRQRITNVGAAVTAAQAIFFRTTIAAVTTSGSASATTFPVGSLASLAAYYDLTNFGICVAGSCTKTAESVTLLTGALTVAIGSGQGGTFGVNGVVKNICVDPTHCPSYGL